MLRFLPAQYSKSSRAKCHGPPPCQGSFIDLGALRYGRISFGEYESQRLKTLHLEYRGCVTPAILQSLAVMDLGRITGFVNLRRNDQTKVRQAIARKRVDPADVPETAKNPQPTTAALPPVMQKRKADAIAGPSSSQTRVSSYSQSTTGNRGSTLTQGVTELSDEEENEESEEESKDELYCVMSTQVVGLQYYKGLVGPGEEVTLIREPQNKYDRNAIQVKNIAGNQVGHLPRAIAGKLAPLLDRRRITVEGIIHDGNLAKRSYSISMTLKIYGASDQRNQLEPLLTWATPKQRGFPPPRADGSRDIPGSTQAPRTYNTPGAPSASQASSQAARLKGLTPEQKRKLEAQQAAQAEALHKAAELKSILNNLEKVDDESRRSSLLDTLCSTEDVINLPVHPNPPGVASGDLMVNLLKHQSQALQWCIDREYPKLPTKETDEPAQFWQFKKNGQKSYYYNLATNTPQEAVPVLGRGALCADSMGLAREDINDARFNSCYQTLVVPLSVLSNWEGQIKEHCQRDALKFYVYYGAARSITSEKMKKYDVIITTYQVVAKEHTDAGKISNDLANPSKKQKTETKGLFGVHWKRIILDEGHTIRNPRTKMAKAVYALQAQRRWVVTGTPIINTPRDLGSVLSFLQICKPLDNEDFFKRLLLRPLKDGMPEGYQLLRAVMTQICIRRTKEMHDSTGNPLVPLPGVEMIMIPIQLDPKTRELYDAVEDLSQQKFQAQIDARGGVSIPTNVLSMLTRLRQIVLHPGLVPSNYLDQLQNSCNEDNEVKAGALIKVTPQLKVKLQAILAQLIEDNEECPVCFDVLDEPRITGCAHVFCLACISEVIMRDARCPMDRREITMADITGPAPPTELTHAAPPREDEEDEEDELRVGSSAKIDQLVHLLQLTPGNEKSLVFSQFTSFLDKIGGTLDEVGISYARFDGKMSAKRRQETLERFCVPVQDDQSMSSSESSSLSSRLSPAPKATPVGLRRRKISKIVLDDDDNFVEEVVAKDDDDDDFLEDGDVSAWIMEAESKGKGKGKAKKTQIKKSLSSFTDSFLGSTNPKVMLISLKAGALGLNLTVANNVYLMDPIGQKKKVHVYQLIAENTVESKVIDIQEKKKKLVNEAFSGIKNTDNPRQKKEARMQDLIELFGIRQKEATQRQATLDDHVVGS
ncbi:hypothetical protein EW145_g2943 [Phellinidium pouzarii]|uniref:RING-type domain-containing protein n=1 Tax=Phellinidium pouzarii TaxID=167371 RepID=A0A4S4L9F7_9AGAM|nr:hypothetical protein EW145_g2943 [Phellinidium pouzarii]